MIDTFLIPRVAFIQMNIYSIYLIDGTKNWVTLPMLKLFISNQS